MPLREEVIDALRRVMDPELQLDVWQLGLIYDLKLDAEGNLKILMTLTTPSCPYADELLNSLKQVVTSTPGVKSLDLELTFDPPWKPSEEIQTMLGIW
jgi:metal-sulfur cluster biosynthetic enzyme